MGVEASTTEIGYSHINCTGNEVGLEKCTIGNLTSEPCLQAGIAVCFNGNKDYIPDIYNVMELFL